MGLCNEMSVFYSVSLPLITHSVFKETFTLPTLPSPIFSPEKSGRTILHYSVSKEKIEKERARLGDELNRGYVDDMSELKQYGGKAMVDSWSKPFYNAFSEFKSVQLYEILMACLE
ncbi:hypothetical protein ES288_A12G243100v1 [Gossypium darwinii]|uniref:Uncharacterized protein n=1 Tax=Gossypium darwinii TaxID=34276 RepID=A0A5D2EDH2_GOSDA|nr:hypothetical protein ES288_A12G243100v1 [Gossypium darwinii]